MAATGIQPSGAAGTAHDGAPWTLGVVVRPGADRPVLREEPVSRADLAEARSEAWFNGFLRRGFPDLALEDVTTRLRPRIAQDQCTGFLLLAESGGRVSVHPFDLESLAHVAQRCVRRLVREGQLAEGAAYVYGLRPHHGAEPPAPGPPEAFHIRTVAAPLRYTRCELAPLLARARPVGAIPEGLFPVLFSEQAHGKALRYSRKGAAEAPAVETGAILVGELCACPATGEMFVTVTDAIEVHDAESSEFALVPTSRTWTGVESVLRRLAESRPTLRLVGQAHGHNFALGGEPCADCATAAECGRTTIFVSSADRAFMRTVFAGQPFALCWIAGTNARGEEVARLYSLRAGVLRPRGYHVAPGPLP